VYGDLCRAEHARDRFPATDAEVVEQSRGVMILVCYDG
jgi:hypothetical protein